MPDRPDDPGLAVQDGDPVVAASAPSTATIVPTSLLRAALRPRMLGLLLVLLVAAAFCARLGVWQLDRAQVHGAAAQARHVADLVAAPPVPLAAELAAQTSFRGELVGRKVSTSGTYDAGAQLLVPGRELTGRIGSIVLTPLRLADGSVLAVARGWVPPDAPAPAPPAGRVDVVGYLQISEEAGTGVRDGRVDAISSAELVNVWGGPTYTGYLVAASSDPAQDGVELLGPPSRPGSGLNVQNLAYAVQWWVFGAFCVLLWVRLVRDEAHGGRRLDPEQPPLPA